MQRILAETAGRPDQYAITSFWGSTLPQLGQIQLARSTFLRAADQAASAKSQDAQAGALLNAASAGWMVDRCFDPEPAAKEALQLDKGKLTLIAVATALALCNEEKQATPMLSAIEKRYPEDTLVQELYAPQYRAWLRSRRVIRSELSPSWNGSSPRCCFLCTLYAGSRLPPAQRPEAMLSHHFRMRRV